MYSNALRDASENELNRNYKAYLESKFLFTLISDLVTTEATTSAAAGKDNAKCQKSAIEEHIEKQYWRSFLVTTLQSREQQQQQQSGTSTESAANSSATTANRSAVPVIGDTLLAELLDNERRLTATDSAGDGDNTGNVGANGAVLNAECRSHLLRRLEHKLEGFMTDIDLHLSFFQKQQNAITTSDNAQQQQQQQQLDDESAEATFAGAAAETNARYASTTQTLRALIDSIRANKAHSDKLNQELEVKLEHCYRVAQEVTAQFTRLLDEFRAGFYAGESRARCDQELLTCDLLVSKLATVRAEIVADLYAPERARALHAARSHMQLEARNAADKLAHVDDTLRLFAALGKEFDTLVASYHGLKSHYERSKWTMNKLKESEYTI